MTTLSQKTQTAYPVNGRQIALFAAFVLPAAKLLEVPSLLAQYAKGDLLLPALAHFLLQATLLFGLLIAASKTEEPLFKRLEHRFPVGARIFYCGYALYFLFSAILPLLDLEKFSYAVFFDTAPTVFSFGFFFILSAYICGKGLKSVGRMADISLFLFLIPFLSLIGMGLYEADFSHLLPFVGTKFKDTVYAFKRSTPHFSDTVLLLPLIGNYRPQKGDTAKIMGGYAVGAVSTLLFLAVFFGIYSALAPMEHYAFSKIGQYFPALSVIGRVDLLFVYFLSVVLLFYTCLPLQYTASFFCHATGIKRRWLVSAFLSLVLFVFVLFFNRRYNGIYQIIGNTLTPVFWLIADLLPLFFLFLPKMKEERRA